MDEKRIKNLKRIISKLRLLMSSFEKETTPRMGFKEIRWAITCAIECVEKQIPKKPVLSGDGYYDGQIVYDTWECPNCGKYYEIDYDDYDYCPKCGQAINKSVMEWSAEDE